MAVTSTVDAVQYVGTGALTVYQVPFYFFQAADLVVETDVAGVVTKLTLGIDYTIAGAAVLTGGAITLLAGVLPTGTTLFIARDPALVQDTTFQAQGPIPASALNNGLDLACMQGQATRTRANNSIQIPLVESLAGLVTVLPTAPKRATTYLGFDSSGNVTCLAPNNASGTAVTTTGGNTPRLLSNRFADTLNPIDFGCKIDGSTDDTVAFRSVISNLPANGGTIFIPAGTGAMMISGGLDFSGHSNVRIYSDYATIRFIAGTVDTAYGSWPTYGKDSVLRFVGCSNILIEGLILDGNLPNRTAHATTESFNSALFLAACTHVRVRDCQFVNGMTDGVTIIASNNSGYVLCQDIRIDGCVCDTNRRNAISVIGGTDIWIDGNLLINTGANQGVAPMAGIDIEPDFGTGQCKGIRVTNNTLDGNQGQYALDLTGNGCDDVLIAFNTVLVANQYGINIDAYSGAANYSTNVRCFGNKVTVSAGASGTQQGGIRCTYSNAERITDNIVNGFLSGIQTYSANGLKVKDNDVSGCFIALYAGDATLGFIDMEVTGNDFHDNTNAGGGLGPYNAAVFYPLVGATLIFSNNRIRTAIGAGTLAAGAVLQGVNLASCTLIADDNVGTNLGILEASSEAYVVDPQFNGMDNVNDTTLGYNPSQTAYGQMYQYSVGGQSITITTGGTFYQWITPTAGQNSFWTINGSHQLLAGARAPGLYKITLGATFEGVATHVGQMAVFKNGVQMQDMTFFKGEGASAVLGGCGGSSLVNVAAADVFDVRFTSSSNSDAITLCSINLTLERIRP